MLEYAKAVERNHRRLTQSANAITVCQDPASETLAVCQDPGPETLALCQDPGPETLTLCQDPASETCPVHVYVSTQDPREAMVKIYVGKDAVYVGTLFVDSAYLDSAEVADLLKSRQKKNYGGGVSALWSLARPTGVSDSVLPFHKETKTFPHLILVVSILYQKNERTKAIFEDLSFDLELQRLATTTLSNKVAPDAAESKPQTDQVRKDPGGVSSTPSSKQSDDAESLSVEQNRPSVVQQEPHPGENLDAAMDETEQHHDSSIDVSTEHNDDGGTTTTTTTITRMPDPVECCQQRNDILPKSPEGKGDSAHSDNEADQESVSSLVDFFGVSEDSHGERVEIPQHLDEPYGV